MSPARFLRDLCVVLVCAGAGVWALTRWVAVPWVVDGPSMEPALRDGDHVLVDLWTLRHRPPKPGDVVVFQGQWDEDLVKRVASEPRTGADSFPAPTMERNSPLEPCFPVLGDNPARSLDSRQFGPVPRHRIRGRVAWRYWPPSRLGAIE